MSYVIYHIDTTILFYAKGKRWYNNRYASEPAAKAALTRELKAGRMKNLAIADVLTFHNTIEKKVTKRNLMGGGEFECAVNEPACTDPSTETYWSM
jgi:hypothetical protein